MVSGSHLASSLPNESMLLILLFFGLAASIHVDRLSSLSKAITFIASMLLSIAHPLPSSYSLASRFSMASDLSTLKSGAAICIIAPLAELLFFGAEHFFILCLVFAELRSGAAHAYGAAAFDPPKPPNIPLKLGMLGI